MVIAMYDYWNNLVHFFSRASVRGDERFGNLVSDSLFRLRIGLGRVACFLEGV